MAQLLALDRLDCRPVGTGLDDGASGVPGARRRGAAARQGVYRIGLLPNGSDPSRLLSPFDVIINNRRRVKRLREMRGLSQRALATKAKVTQGLIHQLETGKVQGVRSQAVVKLAKALGVPAMELLG